MINPGIHGIVYHFSHFFSSKKESTSRLEIGGRGAILIVARSSLAQRWARESGPGPVHKKWPKRAEHEDLRPLVCEKMR